MAAERGKLTRTTALARSDDATRFVRFALVGAGGYVVNLIVYGTLVRMRVPYGAAAVAAFCVAVTNNYLWNRLWTFRDRRRGIGPQALRFLLVSVAALGVNLLLLHALVRSGVDPLPAQAVAVVAVTPLSYLGNRLWAFADGVPLAARLGAERAAAYRAILAWWALSRVAVLATALVVQAVRWPRASWYPSLSERPFALLLAWDGRWYRLVAERGYLVLPKHQSDTAFFPLYPALLNVLRSLGLPYGAGGLLLANLSFALGVLALYELVATWLAPDTARRAAIYATLFPVGYVFSMAYPEGIVLAGMAGAGAAAVRNRFGVAAVLAAVATLARPEGVFVAIPLAVLAWRRLQTPHAVGAVGAAVAAPAALAATSLYQLAVVGDPLAFSTAQRAWGRHVDVNGVRRALAELYHASGGNLWLWRDALFCVAYVLLLVVALRAHVDRGWIAAGLLIVLLPLASGSFTSDARFGLLALPVYAGLAVLGRRRLLDLALRPAMLGLLVAATATILLRWP